MKKITLFFLMCFLTVCCFSEEKKLQSLTNGETFILEYDKGLLKVYREIDNKKEFYYEISTRWRAFQLSRDRQQMLVFSVDNGMFCLLDGKTGTFKPVTKKPTNSMTSFDLKYIIWQKNYGDYENRIKMPTIVITDLQTNQDIYEVSWEELQQDFIYDYSFGYHFIRSNEPDYDFIVYASGEGRGNYFGVMKINIANKSINKEMFYGKKIPEPDYPPECYGE